MGQTHVPSPPTGGQGIIERVQELYGLIIVNVDRMPGLGADPTFRLSTSHEHFILKLSKPETQWLEGEHHVIEFLTQHHPAIQYPMIIPSSRGTMPVCQINHQQFKVRLFKFIEGTTMKDLPKYSSELFKHSGQVLGQMASLLAKYQGTVNNQNTIPYDLNSMQKYSQNSQHEDIQKYIKEYEQKVHPFLKKSEKVVIHGDAHQGNIIVDETGSKVVGIIDFGLCCMGNSGFEIGIFMGSLLKDRDKVDFEDLSLAFRNFCEECPLSSEESSLIYYFMTARLVFEHAFFPELLAPLIRELMKEKGPQVVTKILMQPQINKE